jgi:hypothetical protein
VAEHDPTDSPPRPDRVQRRASRDRDNLWWRPERGVFYWRAVHPLTGKRIARSTDQHKRPLARRVAQRFEDELAAEVAGVKTFDAWRVELAPLAEAWLESLADSDEPPLQRTVDQKRAEITRALAALGLRVAADLTHVTKIDDSLRKLARRSEPPITKSTLRRSFQGPLKQFSKWLAENGRHLDRDPLACWKPIKVPTEEQGSDRRSLMPLEAARTLEALEVLDELNGRVGSSRMLFTAMLVAAPRADAMASRDVVHYDPRTKRIDLGAGRGKKNRGACALDATTAKDLEATLAGRGPHDPLFVAADGGRWPTARMLDVWREAHSLALVDELWPADETRDLDLALLVSRSLLKGRLAVSKGGNPGVLSDETLAARRELELRVTRFVERIRDDWTAKRQGVDVHGLRTNLRTWAQAKGCAPVLIDKQLGHGGGRADGDLAVYKAIAGSRVGRVHYLDVESKLFDPSQAAQAVRELLDEAAEQLRSGEVPTFLVRPRAVAKTGATGVPASEVG